MSESFKVCYDPDNIKEEEEDNKNSMSPLGKGHIKRRFCSLKELPRYPHYLAQTVLP